jgi:hypothetical protein
MKAWVRIKDESELKRFVHMNDVYAALADILSYLRAQNKYADPPDDIEKIYEHCWQICSDNAIDPWED